MLTDFGSSILPSFYKQLSNDSGFELNIFKMESWNHMGRTVKFIMKDFHRRMCVPLENSAYFGDEDSFNSNPVTIISKDFSVLLFKSWLHFPCV